MKLGPDEASGPNQGTQPKRRDLFFFSISILFSSSSLQYSIQIQISYFEVQVPSIKYDPIYEYKCHYF
jgi:hypothetical protein